MTSYANFNYLNNNGTYARYHSKFKNKPIYSNCFKLCLNDVYNFDGRLGFYAITISKTSHNSIMESKLMI